MSQLTDTSRLCVHTITTKPWSIEQAAAAYEQAGVAGMTIWRDAMQGRKPRDVAQRLRDHGLTLVSLCRAGFFPHTSKTGRSEALDDNRLAIDEAAALGAPLVVLVCGAVPGQPLALSRDQIQAGIEAVLPHAEACGIKLAIEPLHPMYADDRSAINTLSQGNDMAESIDSPLLGVAIDVYHLWWDPALQQEIQRCGAHNNILAFHVCDWRTPTTDLLLDRGLMGEGCIDIPQIRSWVEAAGFEGFIEVEIFSKKYWAQDQAEFLDNIVTAYLSSV
jgi:sugar phosphate isomerase/epimerase